MTDKIAELEAENARLTSDNERLISENEVLKNTLKSDELQIKNLVKRNEEMRDDCIKTAEQREALATENAALRAELDRALSINNPCLHTGLESFVCEVCGYPDPRKVIAALRTERDNTCKRAEES